MSDVNNENPAMIVRFTKDNLITLLSKIHEKQADEIGVEINNI